MDKLIKQIGNTLKNQNNLKTCYDFLKKYKSNDYKKFVKFSDINYKKNLVYRNTDFEVFVVCWTPKQKTLIHDHSENGCLFKVLEGNIVEYRYNHNKSANYYQHNVGSVEYIDNQIGIHKMDNDSKTNCITLHIYSPPNYKMNIFNKILNN